MTANHNYDNRIRRNKKRCNMASDLSNIFDVLNFEEEGTRSSFKGRELRATGNPSRARFDWQIARAHPFFRPSGFQDDASGVADLATSLSVVWRALMRSPLTGFQDGASSVADLATSCLVAWRVLRRSRRTERFARSELGPRLRNLHNVHLKRPNRSPTRYLP